MYHSAKESLKYRKPAHMIRILYQHNQNFPEVQMKDVSKDVLLSSSELSLVLTEDLRGFDQSTIRKSLMRTSSELTFG